MFYHRICFLFIFFSLAVAAIGAETPNYRVGTWVNYRVTTTLSQLYFSLSNSGALDDNDVNIFSLRLRLQKIDGDKLQVIATITPNAGNPLENIVINDYSLKQLLPAAAGDNLSLTQGKPAVYTFPEKTSSGEEKKIPATQIILYGTGKKIELWKSNEIPFGVAQIICGAFKLELLSYEW